MDIDVSFSFLTSTLFLFETQSERDRDGENLPPAGLLPTWPQWLELGLFKARSQELL